MTAAKPETPETSPPRFFVSNRLAANLAFYSGMTMGCASIAMLGYTIASSMLGAVVNGWTSIAMIALALGSKQLLLRSLFGEQLDRLHALTSGRLLDGVDAAASMTETQYEEAGEQRRIAA